MSRLATLSPAALRAMFAQHADDTLITLVTITGDEISNPIRLADNYTHRFEYLSDTEMTVTDLSTKEASVYTFADTDTVIKDAVVSQPEEIFYGVIATTPRLFLPFAITLPTEEPEASSVCQIKMYDVTRMLIPTIRSITEAPSVLIELVLMSTPNNVEAEFPGFLLGGITYNRDEITAQLTVESDVSEPFPAYCFTPSYFPSEF